MDYNKILAQRNALLKYFAINRIFNKDNLEIYNHQMIELSGQIHKKRIAFMESFIPVFKQRYDSISANAESVNIHYNSDLNESDMEKLLYQNLERDKVLQYTSVGIHKDDLDFEITEVPIKKFGSQGQQKSFLIALKLAQFDFIKKIAEVNPIVLLDDIFDKLDQNRVTQTIKLFENETIGQIFISDTHEDRLKNALTASSSKYEIFNLN